MYAHQLLQLNIIPETDFVTQTAFYKSRLNLAEYGLPLDSNAPSLSRSDWMMFIAAMATDNTLRDELITQLHKYASPNKQNQPFVTVYNPETADQITGSSSPAQGAMFALLALNVPVILNTASGTANNGARNTVEDIAGGVVAGVCAIVGGVIFFRRRRRIRNADSFNNRTEQTQSVNRVKPEALSSDAIGELQDPMTEVPNTESLLTLCLQPVQRMFGVARFANHGQSAVSPFIIPPPTSGVTSRYIIPPTGDIMLQKQRPTKRTSGADDTRVSNTTPSAPVPSRVEASLADESGPIHNSDVNLPNTNLDLMSQLDNLRREVERMRQNHEALQEAPPLYDSV